jgi:hypothetical protein
VPTLCLVAAASGGYSAAVQVRALAALGDVCGDAAAAAQLPAQLPLLLAALGSPEAAVRSAAAECVSQLAAAPGVAAPLPELFSALADQRALVAANPCAAASAIGAALRAAQAAAAAAKPAARGRKPPVAAAAPEAPGAALDLAPEVARAVSELLLQQLPGLAGPAGLAGAQACLACLLGSLPGLDLLSRALPLLSSALASLCTGAPSKQLAAQQGSVASSLAALFTPEAVASPELAAALFAALGTTAREHQPPAAAAGEQLAAVRAAALRALTPELLAALGQGRQASALQLLLEASSADPSLQCRAAARAALEQVPIEAAALVPLLSLASSGAAAAAAAGQPTPAKKARRGAKAEAAAAAAEPAAAAAAAAEEAGVDPRSLDRAVAALELLQWKAGVGGAAALLQPLQALLLALLPVMDSVAVPHHELTAEGELAEEAGAAQQQQQQQQAGKSSAAGYAAQLALLYLQGLAARLLVPGAGAGGFDLGLVVRLAQRAPDSAVRNAALALLALLAQVAPQDALAHVLQVRWPALARLFSAAASGGRCAAHRAVCRCCSGTWLRACCMAGGRGGGAGGLGGAEDYNLFSFHSL